MAMSDMRKLKKLIVLQGLVAAKQEASLAVTNARIKYLSEERDALFALGERNHSGTKTSVDPSILMKRLSNNSTDCEKHVQRADVQRSSLLQEQRRLELLKSRLKAAHFGNERQELTQLVAEFVGRNTSILI